MFVLNSIHALSFDILHDNDNNMTFVLQGLVSELSTGCHVINRSYVINRSRNFRFIFIYIQMDNSPPQIECCTSRYEVAFFPDFRQNGGFFNLTKYKLQWWRLSSWTVCDEIENVSEIFCYKNWKSESDHWSLLLWSGNAGCMM